MTNLQYKKTYTVHVHTLKGMFIHFFLYVHINKGMFIHHSCGVLAEMLAHITSFPGHQLQLAVVVMIHRTNH